MENLETDILCKLEGAQAQLSDDINFLHCIHEQYLSDQEPHEYLQYLYWQLQAMIITLTKSMEYNQKEMQETIDKVWEEKRLVTVKEPKKEEKPVETT